MRNKEWIVIGSLVVVAGNAHAQSSVALYGTVDLNTRYVKNDGSRRRLSMGTGGLNTGQLGFRGEEDLGGGLKASFVLLANVAADLGTGGSSTKFFDRRSTVSLSGKFGEVRLGRDYVPTYWNNSNFDPFGGVGIGAMVNLSRNFSGLAVPGAGGGSVAALNSFTRHDNAMGYFLPPNLGGLYGQLMAAAAEGGTFNPGRYLGGRIGYTAGAINVAAAYSQERAALAGQPKVTIWNVGAWYNFSAVKLMASYHNDENDIPAIDVRERRWLVGAIVPLGAGQIQGSYQRSTANVGPRASMYALGGVYNLSKRTALYATLSMIKNGGGAVTGGNLAIASVAGGSSTALPARGGDSKGAEIGIRHFF